MTAQTSRVNEPAALRTLRRRSRRLQARSRLRAANLRRTGMALTRPRATPVATAGHVGAGVDTVYGAPRTLLFVTVKRDNPTWRDLYGHWWLEVGDQSWGWWPRAVPVGLRQLVFGTGGVLNGIGLLGRSGTWYRDAQHGQGAAHAFHPVLVLPLSDEQVRARLQEYAHGYQGAWKWAWTARAQHDTCRSFQDGLLQAAGLQEQVQHLASRGSGCPLLYRPRTVLWWLQDRADARSPTLTRGDAA